MEDLLPQLKSLLWTGGLAATAIGVVVILYRYVLQRYYQMHDRSHPRAASREADPAEASEPEEQDDTIPLASLATRSNMKTWKVCGVEKANGNDATWYIEAESRANAKVKAELKGMIVTAVERALA